MPGWLTHMNVARKSLSELPNYSGAAGLFGADGPDAASLRNIAQSHPAYVALGSIGPDFFYFLPDFKEPYGPTLRGLFDVIEETYKTIDPYLVVYEEHLGPVNDNMAEIQNGLSGGLISTLQDTVGLLLDNFKTAVLIFLARQRDWFGVLDSGVPRGYDEHTFFWSDMLHYRKTFEFAAQLWRAAQTDQARAFALGWMTHLGTDVVGHAFVNQKCGGPYRLHWQRHHLIENHMDALIYGNEFGNQAIYQALCCSAQHLWIAFNEEATEFPSSYSSFFNPGARPTYDPNDEKDRSEKWDVDSDMPPGLSKFLVECLKSVYPSGSVSDPYKQCADHPNILPYNEGYPTAAGIDQAFFYLFKYVKFITTDCSRLKPPEPPELWPIPSWPSLPGSGGSGNSGNGNGSSDPGITLCDLICDILALIEYVKACLLFFASVLAAIILGTLTYPLRAAIYYLIELPLYQLYLSFHWVTTITGYTTPFPAEISPPLHTLGIGWQAVWSTLEDAINDISGGLLGFPGSPGSVVSEPSGANRDKSYPHDAITDPPGYGGCSMDDLIRLFSDGMDEGPTEFTRPWRWPDRDNQGNLVPTELDGLVASPFRSGQNAQVLMTPSPGNAQFRKDLENAKSADETIGIANNIVNNPGVHLGDPSDYSAYIIARLTRNTSFVREALPQQAFNFNLDADRGYGFLCWDWLRSQTQMAVPKHYSPAVERSYHAPIDAGFGWDKGEEILVPPPIPPPVAVPTQHAPDLTNPPVKVRYIDNEERDIA